MTMIDRCPPPHLDSESHPMWPERLATQEKLHDVLNAVSAIVFKHPRAGECSSVVEHLLAYTRLWIPSTTLENKQTHQPLLLI